MVQYRGNVGEEYQPTLMILETKDTTSPNLLMSTSKWFSSLRNALSVTILDRARTAPKLRRYPTGSSCGSGGFGMSILGMLGEKGVGGVPVPEVLAVPADERFMFMMRPVEKPGDLMLEEPELSDDFDLELLREGVGA